MGEVMTFIGEAKMWPLDSRVAVAHLPPTYIYRRSDALGFDDERIFSTILLVML
jgi:hypothetical protein